MTKKPIYRIAKRRKTLGRIMFEASLWAIILIMIIILYFSFFVPAAGG